MSQGPADADMVWRLQARPNWAPHSTFVLDPAKRRGTICHDDALARFVATCYDCPLALTLPPSGSQGLPDMTAVLLAGWRASEGFQVVRWRCPACARAATAKRG